MWLAAHRGYGAAVSQLQPEFERAARPKRRYGTILRHLRDEPATASELAEKMSDELLLHVGQAISDEQRRRALASGDQATVIAHGFDNGFGRDGLAVPPWIEAGFVVCPGGLVQRNPANHRCAFVSVNDVWVWESSELVHEEKRSTPGKYDGFRAVALLPLLEGMELDFVRGKMRSGQHSAEQVISYALRRGTLVEVSQRNLAKRSGNCVH